MSPAPALLNKVIPFPGYDFGSLHPSLSGVVDALTRAREHAVSLVAPLPAFRERTLADDLTAEKGKHLVLSQKLNAVKLDIGVAYDHPLKLTERAALDANGAVSQAIYAPHDKPNLVGPVQAALSSLAFSRADLKPAQLAPDTDAAALLTTGGPVHHLLQRVLQNASLRDAALVVLALQRADPFTSALVGGTPVIESARKIVEARAAAENPDIAGYVTLRADAGSLLRMVKSDIATAHAYAHRAVFGRAPDDTHARPA